MTYQFFNRNSAFGWDFIILATGYRLLREGCDLKLGDLQQRQILKKLSNGSYLPTPLPTGGQPVLP